MYKTDAISRQPVQQLKLTHASPTTACKWYQNRVAAVKQNLNEFADYSIVNGQLYRRIGREINEEDATPRKLCVPTPLRRQVLQEVHDQPAGGHLGVRKTLRKLTCRYYWPGMSRDISRYVRGCKVCQQYKVSQQLPEIMLAINNSTSESTSYTPAHLTQGREPRLPQALYDKVTIGTGSQIVPPESRTRELAEVFEIVRQNSVKSSQKQKYHYNLHRRQWQPKIGERVLVRQHPISKAVDKFAAKLAPKYGGPYVVAGSVSPVIANISSEDNKETRTAHLSELKPFTEQHNKSLSPPSSSSSSPSSLSTASNESEQPPLPVMSRTRQIRSTKPSTTPYFARRGRVV